MHDVLVADGKQNRRIWKKTSGDDSDDGVKLQNETRKNMRLGRMDCHDAAIKSFQFFFLSFGAARGGILCVISAEMSQKKMPKRSSTNRRFRKSGTKKAIAIEPYTYPSSSNSDSSGKLNSMTILVINMLVSFSLENEPALNDFFLSDILLTFI